MRIRKNKKRKRYKSLVIATKKTNQTLENQDDLDENKNITLTKQSDPRKKTTETLRIISKCHKKNEPNLGKPTLTQRKRI